MTARATERASSLLCLSIIAIHNILDLHITGALAQGDDIIVYAVPRVKYSEFRKGPNVPTVICIVVIQIFHFNVVRCCQEFRVLQNGGKSITCLVFQPQNADYMKFVKTDYDKR